MTPVSNIVGAYKYFLENKSVTGKVMECAGKERKIIPEPELVFGKVTKRAVTVYNPLHETMHGEPSGLEDSVS